MWKGVYCTSDSTVNICQKLLCELAAAVILHDLYFTDRSWFFMCCWQCISIYLCNENQLDALFILSLFRHSTSTCFGHICSPSSGGFFSYSATRVMASSFLRFLDHTQRRTTVGRTSLDEWSARRRDLYLTTHNTHNRKTSMPPVGFEPTTSAGEWSQTYALDRTATGTGHQEVYCVYVYIYIYIYIYTYIQQLLRFVLFSWLSIGWPANRQSTNT